MIKNEFRKLERIRQETMINPYKIILGRNIDISQIVIPFSKIFKSYKPIDLYTRDEKIPFKERDPEYKMIMCKSIQII